MKIYLVAKSITFRTGRLMCLVFLFWMHYTSCTSLHNNTSVEAKEYSANSHTDTLQWPAGFAFGREATATEIALWDIDISPDGTGLPEGRGTVETGKVLYLAKCAICHGQTGTEGPYNRLVTTSQDSTTSSEAKTIGKYWPYATTLFDYIRRTMPFHAPGTLTDNEVYSLTAFLLHANTIIDSTTVMNAKTLPAVVMPAKELFVPDDRRGGPEVK
jgi:S-disulfanyl-L-cysteine oxidoreductase SoxD